MKTRFYHLAFSLVFCFVFSSLSAQTLIKVNPIGLAFGTINASFEKFVSDNASFTLRANFYSRNLIGIRYSGFGAGAGYRFYLSNNERPKGLYAGPIANVGFIGTGESAIGNYTLITIGAVIGYQLMLSDRWTLDFNVGPTYGIISGGNIDDGTNVYGGGTLPSITIATVGYVLN